MLDLEQLIIQVPGQLNFPLLIGLMAIGYIIKNTKALSRVSNKIIPLILLVFGVVVSIILGDSSGSDGVAMAVINGLANAAIAVWLHETGKNVFEMMNVDKLKGDNEK